jgi:hypothetical protein
MWACGWVQVLLLFDGLMAPFKLFGKFQTVAWRNAHV